MEHPDAFLRQQHADQRLERVATLRARSAAGADLHPRHDIDARLFQRIGQPLDHLSGQLILRTA